MKKLIITIIIALLFGGGGTFAWLYYGGFEGESESAIVFIEVYGDYMEIVEHVEYFVNLPGSSGNVDRAELLALLNSILTDKLEPIRREELARLAFTNLDVLKKEIDSAQASQARLYKMLQDLDNTAKSFSSIDLRNRSLGLVDMARKRAELSSRITSVLSETNEHIYSIITRILADGGELTQKHMININASTLEAEDRFDTLNDLYKELADIKNEMDIVFKDFARVAI